MVLMSCVRVRRLQWISSWHALANASQQNAQIVIVECKLEVNLSEFRVSSE